jgi:hypothetical protein
LLTPEAVYRLKVQGKAKTTQANMWGTLHANPL